MMFKSIGRFFVTSVCMLVLPAVASSESGTWFENSVHMTGFFQEEVGNSYQHDDFEYSKILSTADVTFDINFNENWKAKINARGSYDAAYSVEGREKFTRETLDMYETDLRFNEIYTDIDVNSWTNIRFGRQYFSWGESNSEQISDIGNSRDLRELGLQNVKDIRLPVGATKITFYDTSWEYSLIAIHEVRPDELGAEGSEFDPFLAARRQVTILDDDVPASSLKNTGVMSRLYLSQAWGDISFFAGRKFEGFPGLKLESADLVTQQLVFRPEYQKVSSYGFFGNVIEGSWQFKFDVARSLNKPMGRSIDNLVEQLLSGQNQEVISLQNKNFLKSMLGIEYSGISDTQISLEFINEHIEDYENTLRDEEDLNKISLFVSRKFLNDSVSTSLWLNHIQRENTNLFRFDLGYDYSDSVKLFVSLSGVEGAKKGTYYYDYLDTDRLSLGVKVSF